MSHQSLEEPSLEEAKAFIQEALSRRRMLLVVGNCMVDYEGRASSKLDWGERLLVVKSDGSVMVHRPTGYEPVNWQPPGSIFHVEFEDGKLKIRATRLQPKEVLNIFFDRVYHVFSAELRDEGEFSMYVTEMDMQKALLTMPELVEEGFQPLAAEKELGESGFLDILGQDSQGNLVVVEIKRNPAGREAVLQLERYVKTLREKTGKQVRGVIVAPEIRREAQGLLAALKLEFRQVSPRRCYEVLKAGKGRKLSEFI
ncbi:MAG: endonuclease NucS [Candidatus Hecatellales archaeon]|nr:MAG: endonuclease NucS [Candidatus Hecatellales archaeon]